VSLQESAGSSTITAPVSAQETSPALHYAFRRWIVLVISGLALLLGVAFVWLHGASPSDGTRFEPGQQTWIPAGVVVSPLERQPGGLEAGDVIVSINGRSLESWEEGFFDLEAPHPQWHIGQTVTYTVQRNGHVVTVPVVLQRYPWQGILQQEWSLLLYFLVFALVGTYVFLRRPSDPATRVLFLATSTLLAAEGAWSLGLQVSDITGGAGFWIATALALIATPLCWAAFLHFVLLFPRVHPVLQGRPWILPCLYTLPFLANLAYLTGSAAMARGSLDWIAPWNLASYLLIVVYMALIVVVLWSNFRARLDVVAHQQIRWIVFAGLLSGGSDLLLWIIPTGVFQHPIIGLNVLGILLLPIPLALAIAILRYHVFDIDTLINRALVYGSLTALVATIYAGLIIGLEGLAEAITRGTSSNPPVLVISTLAIFALFGPLRHRIQRLIDRRFYRSKYDAGQTLTTFITTLRNEVDLDQLHDHLLTVVQETMQPETVSLWLRQVEAYPKQVTPYRESSPSATAGSH
jgi:two-component system NarL family sensor kinase